MGEISHTRRGAMMKKLLSISSGAALVCCICISAGMADSCSPLPKPIATAQCDPNILRPTQSSLGLGEVKDREAKLVKKSRKQAKYFKERHPVVIKGPGGRLYIVDHHHLVRMAIDMKIPKLTCDIIADYSKYNEQQFWDTLKNQCWAYLKNELGNDISFMTLPERVSELKDDPYRTLAWHVRNAGGYCKSSTPFAEFTWAGFFRKAGVKPDDQQAALAEAKNCGGVDAALPGCKKSPSDACAANNED